MPRSLGGLAVPARATPTDVPVLSKDAGQVSEKISPEVTDLSVGAGLGFRYYTDFGPLRFDIATPLTDKGTVDSSFQVYISIGQAF